MATDPPSPDESEPRANAAPNGAADAEVRLPLPAPLDLRATLGIHSRGRNDPTMRFEVSGSCWRATRTPEGPATGFYEVLLAAGDAPQDEVRVRTWGPGARWLVAAAPAVLGLDDSPEALVPHHAVVAEAARRRRGMRIGWTGAVLEALVPAVLEQKVTGDEARRAWYGILRTWGEPAPGPAGEAGMRVPPEPRTLAAAPYHAFHPLGLERRRAELVRAVAREAARLERAGVAAAGPEAAPGARDAFYSMLRAFPGIGPWTAAEVGARALGDPDAVSVADFHLPNLVCFALAGEPRGTDERMLQLLAPYAGQRGRVIRLLELSGVEPPKFGPRLSPRRIEGI